MKINDVYNKYAAVLLAAAENGKPFAAMTYRAGCADSRVALFASKAEASAHLDSQTRGATGRGGVVAETCPVRKACKAFYVPPVTGFCPSR